MHSKMDTRSRSVRPMSDVRLIALYLSCRALWSLRLRMLQEARPGRASARLRRRPGPTRQRARRIGKSLRFRRTGASVSGVQPSAVSRQRLPWNRVTGWWQPSVRISPLLRSLSSFFSISSTGYRRWSAIVSRHGQSGPGTGRPQPCGAASRLLPLSRSDIVCFRSCRLQLPAER
jgi:hypothetical protein